uniref:Uncharacterized protein n=1 Tax=Parascaris equorum TaxID=6256 RepID=A0A914SK89_PAREQ
MSQVVSGWERIARQFLERCRGFSIDEVVDEKRRILEGKTGDEERGGVGSW